MFQFIPKVFTGAEVRILSESDNSSPTLANHVFVDLALYVVAFSCWNRFGPGNLNATAYKGIFDNCLLPTWQQFCSISGFLSKLIEECFIQE